MKYNDLQSPLRKSGKRVGRGIAAGQGKTAGRGTKGQGARTGSSKKPGFEGGQNPLMQRLPKLHGFTSYKTPAENVFTDQLNDLGSKIDVTTLLNAGLISSQYIVVKLLNRGDVTKKLEVSLPKASAAAVAAIETAGGSFKQTPRLSRPASKPKSDK